MIYQGFFFLVDKLASNGFYLLGVSTRDHTEFEPIDSFSRFIVLFQSCTSTSSNASSYVVWIVQNNLIHLSLQGIPCRFTYYHPTTSLLHWLLYMNKRIQLLWFRWISNVFIMFLFLNFLNFLNLIQSRFLCFFTF